MAIHRVHRWGNDRHQDFLKMLDQALGANRTWRYLERMYRNVSIWSRCQVSCSEGGVATDFTLVVWMFCWFMLVLSPSKHISIKLTFSHSSMSRHFLVFGAKNTRTRAQQLNWIGSYPFYPGWNEAWGFFFGATKPKSPVFRCSTGEYQRSVCPMPVPTCSNMFWPDSLHESRWRSRTSWHSHVKSSERQLSSWCESESDQELQLVYIGLLMHLDDMRGCNTRATFSPKFSAAGPACTMSDQQSVKFDKARKNSDHQRPYDDLFHLRLQSLATGAGKPCDRCFYK